MAQTHYEKLAKLAQKPEALARSVVYLQENLCAFLKSGERVLILCPKSENTVGQILGKAIEACGCVPLWIGEDMRWMTLLKTAFTTRCSCLVGPPLMLLGLSKLAKQMQIPLSVTNVLMAGYPTTQWLVDGVRENLDCMAWGCFDPGEGAVIGGFTCKQLDGIHIRDDVYTVEIEDENGRRLPDGESGRVVLYPNEEPSVRFAIGDWGRLDTNVCSCGNPAPKLVDVDTIKTDNEALSELGESLHYWSSILDCRMEKTDYGVELELVVFPGEKLPKLPTVARQIIRPFDPERDVPFAHQNVLKKRFQM